MNYNNSVELTNLKAPKSKDLKKLVEKAINNNYYGICVQSSDLTVVNKYKKDLKIITVAGFPPIHTFNLFKKADRRLYLSLGLYDKTEINHIKQIIDSNLSDELDIVFPMYWYMTGRFLTIHKFLKGVVKRYKKPVKVIVELGTIFTNRIAIYEITDLLLQSGVSYFKTNTGLIAQDFNSLLSNILYAKMIQKEMDILIPIKASGGIRTVEQAKQLIKHGVDRIGTSSLGE